MLARLRGSVTALLVGWVATRALLLGALTGLVPYPDGPSILNDVKLYSEWSSLLVTGRFPIGDDMWQYPPGAGVVFAIAALLGSNPVAAFTLIALACDLATLAVLTIAGRRRRVGLDAAWAWVIGGLLVGPVWLARFDVIPRWLPSSHSCSLPVRWPVAPPRPPAHCSRSGPASFSSRCPADLCPRARSASSS